MVAKGLFRMLILTMLFVTLPVDASFTTSTDVLFKMKKMSQIGYMTQKVLNNLSAFVEIEQIKNETYLTKIRTLEKANNELIEKIRVQQLHVMTNATFSFRTTKQQAYYEFYHQYTEQSMQLYKEALTLSIEAVNSTTVEKKYSELSDRDKTEYDKILLKGAKDIFQSKTNLNNLKAQIISKYHLARTKNQIPQDLRTNFQKVYDQLLLEIETENTIISNTLKQLQTTTSQNEIVRFNRYFNFNGNIYNETFFSSNSVENTNTRVKALLRKIDLFEHQLEAFILEAA
ncbi:MAG: hypothetical protein ACRCWQ_08635 [Bacilli bacterium]